MPCPSLACSKRTNAKGEGIKPDLVHDSRKHEPEHFQSTSLFERFFNVAAAREERLVSDDHGHLQRLMM